MAALNRSGEVAYEKAPAIAHTMEPSALEVWVPQIETKLRHKQKLILQARS